MSDAANATIPVEIRQQFPCDDHGRILWFTTPPLNTATDQTLILSHKDGKPLVHTPEYFAAKEKRKELIEERKRQAQARSAEDQSARAEEVGDDHHPSSKRRRITDAQAENIALQTLVNQMLDASREWYRSQYGDRAAEAEQFDNLRAAERRNEVKAKESYLEERRLLEEERRKNEKLMEGRVFQDDWDGRH